MPSKIKYVDETWNPVTGCTKISPGCANCYAERMARRLAGRFGYPEAPNHFDVTLHPDRLDEPLRRKKPTRYLVCSMGDLFHADVLMETLFDVWFVMQEAKRHTFLVLTKRPDRARGFFDEWMFSDPSVGIFSPGILPNVWLGVTVESQDEMWRVEELLKIPAAKHWVSIEPMLGPVDLGFGPKPQCSWCSGRGSWGAIDSKQVLTCECMTMNTYLDFVVLGGETGPGARPCNPGWVRKVRDDCVAAGVDFFFKGWGAWWTGDEKRIYDHDNQPMWSDGAPMMRLGKKAAGRLLDGREWDEMPE